MATERIGIEISTIGYKEAMEQIRNVERAVSGFRGKNAKIQLDDGRVVTVNQRIKELRDNLSALKSAKAQVLNQETISPADKQKIRQINKEIRNTNAELNRLTTASRSAGRSLRQTFNSISSQVAHVGGAMQSMGNALSRLFNPLRSLMRGTIFAAGYKLLDLATSGISGATERADVFKTYAKSLEALGYDANEKFAIGANDAKNALDNLEESVLGLPTGLDEIVASQKKYLAASGDMKKATEAAIAANNIFLAQGSDQKDQLRGARQLRNLLSGGDMTSARWQSLLESMPMAINEVGEAMRRNGDFAGNMDEFRQALLGGQIDQNKFLDALLEVGTSGRIRAAVEEMKHTYGSVTANISNAFRRMGENVLKTLDSTLLSTTGKDTIDWLLQLKGAIDKFSTGLQNWIKANPEVFTRFFDEIKNFDWAGFAQGIGEGLIWSLNRLYDAMHLISRLDLRKIAAFLGKSGVIGWALTVSGGIVKGSRHPLAAIGTLISGIAQALMGLGSTGAEKGIGTLGRLGGGGKSGLSSALSGIVSVLKVAGTIAIAGGTAAFTMKSFKTAVTSFSEIVETIKGVDWETGRKVLLRMGEFIGGLAVAGWAVMKIPPEITLAATGGTAVIGLFTSLVAKFAEVDMKMLENATESFKHIAENIEDAIERINGVSSMGVNTSNLDVLVQSMQEVYNAMKPKYQGTGIENMSAREGERIASVIGSLSKAISEMDRIAQMMNDMTVINDGEAVRQNMTDILDTLNQVYADASQFYEPKDTGNSDGIKKTIENVVSMVSSIKGSVDNLNELAEVKLDIDAAKDKIGEMQTALLELLHAAEDMFTTTISGSEYNAGRMGVNQQTVNDASNVTQIFSYIQSMLSTLKNAYVDIMDAAVEWDPYGLESRLEVVTSIFERMKNWYDQLDFPEYEFQDSATFAANVQGAVSAIQNLKSLVEAVNELAGMDTSSDLSGVIGAFHQIIPQLEELATQVEEMAKLTTDAMKEGFDFEGVNTAVSAGMNGVLSTAEGFRSKLQAKGTSLGKAFSNSLKASMKTVNVPTTVNVNAKLGVISGLTAIARTVDQIARDTVGKVVVTKPVNSANRSHGGLIYRAGGGSIFRPRGTDTVPAMLTPGEYVHRRDAVKMFGKDFMSRVNNLDVEGAMRALHARFGNQITNARSTKITNIVNNNNNQTYAPRIYTNSENFVLKRSSRFAGAI